MNFTEWLKTYDFATFIDCTSEPRGGYAAMWRLNRFLMTGIGT